MSAAVSERVAVRAGFVGVRRCTLTHWGEHVGSGVASTYHDGIYVALDLPGALCPWRGAPGETFTWAVIDVDRVLEHGLEIWLHD